MSTYIKTQTASLIASVIDFIVTIICREVLGFWYVAATITGTLAGGIINFSLGRKWVFRKQDTKLQIQLLRYFLIWNGNFLLNVTGVFIMTSYMGINYIISKVFTSVLLGTTYNYLLQKKYVFR
ncbi:MAG: GtrA family protein [Flavipsychrobacter sp.]|nr:GtrA family protein [Flavipsychrobacter sp.]